MPRHCTTCDSEARDAIDRELLAGTPFRDIAERYGVSVSALNRHRQTHVDRRLAQAHDDTEMDGAAALLAHLRSVETETERLRTVAEAKGDIRTALAAIRELTRILELKARVAERRTVPIDQAVKVVRAIAMAVKRHVTDQRTLLAIRDEMSRYSQIGIDLDGRLLPRGAHPPNEPLRFGARAAAARETTQAD